MNTEVVANLRVGRGIIADAKNWRKGNSFDDDEPCCGANALERASRTGHVAAFVPAFDALDASAEKLYPDSKFEAREAASARALCPSAWVNDTYGHAAILAVYDDAIATEEAK